jgi:hypothetical protein
MGSDPACTGVIESVVLIARLALWAGESVGPDCQSPAATKNSAAIWVEQAFTEAFLTILTGRQ